MPIAARTPTRRRRRLARASALGLIALCAGPAASAFGDPPAASFIWFPPTPAPGEPVTLVSTSTDASSPITGFAWDLGGDGAFAEAGPVSGTSFPAPGDHVVRLLVTNGDGQSAVATEAIPVRPPGLPVMEPFPVVRFVAGAGGSGVRLLLLSVEAPKGARVTVTCRGHGCPVDAETRVAASGGPGTVTVTFRRFERRLPAGLVLEVRVARSGEIGKYTRLVIRHHKLPSRFDACVEDTAPTPVGCRI